MVQNLYKFKLKMFQYSPLYSTDAHFCNSSMNIRSTSFFSSSDTHQSHYLYGCHAKGINSPLIFFLSALCFSYLIWQVKSLTWIIVSESFSSKLVLSMLMQLRYMLRIPTSFNQIQHYQNLNRNWVYFHLDTRQ